MREIVIMDTDQLEFYCKNNNFTSKIFGGVFASNIFRSVKHGKTPKVYFINSCNDDVTSNDPESEYCHWVSIFIDDTHIVWFDSAGGDSYRSNPNIRHFINKNRKKRSLIVNRKQIQSMKSIRCGLFVLLFAYCMAIGFDYEKFLRVFDYKSLDNNDTKADNLFYCTYLKNKRNMCFKPILKIKS